VAAKLPLAGPLVSSVCSALAAPRHGRDPWRDDCDHPRQPRTPRERVRRRVNSAAQGPVLESRPEGRTGQHPTRRALEAAGERQGGGRKTSPGSATPETGAHDRTGDGGTRALPATEGHGRVAGPPRRVSRSRWCAPISCLPRTVRPPRRARARSLLFVPLATPCGRLVG
jgi:hypothetical protein